MKDSLLKVYHHAPYTLKVLAASAWGYYLRWWRYGPETERLVDEAREREYWRPEQWQTWQENRLGYVLHRAATRVPYYREQWAERRRRGDRASWEYLENWPILEKEPLRQNPKAFVADDCNLKNMLEDHTSGTTGKPLVLWMSRNTVQVWYALFEARWLRWYGLNRHDRWAHIGGRLVTPVTSRQPPFWVWNAGLNQLYMSSYHLAPDLISHYVEALKRYRVKYLLGYSSSLYTLAQEVLRRQLDETNISAAITDAEPLFDYQRKAIVQAFRCKVHQTYGMSEMVAAASECESDSLHLWPEAGCLEHINDGHEVGSASGQLISTGLINPDMPLIRYRVGDRTAQTISNHECPCGRNLPVLPAIQGRIDDLLYTKDGRKIGRLDPVFKTDLPILEAQIIQESLDLIKIRIVPALGFSEAATGLIVDRLRERMGQVDVLVEQVSEIPRGAHGKFRAVVCNLSDEEKARLSKIG
ncbi:MAG: phenylacetate--CoA ligase family protein [Thermodesulfobacteriota bacterium]